MRYVTPPPIKLDPRFPQLAPPAPPCPAGQVPQPNPILGAVKGLPAADPEASVVTPDPASSKPDFFFDHTTQPFTGLGAEAYFTIDQPVVAPADIHSLAELVVESANGKQIIEVGWMVSPTLFSDANTHLFVYYWVNGKPQGYDANFTQISTTIMPGTTLEATSTPQAFDIEYMASQDAWYVGYQGEWIGYFAGSLWSGKFTTAGNAIWSGEVEASSKRPTSQMGNGILGTSPGAAEITNMGLYQSDGTLVPASAPTPTQTNATFYAVGNFTGASFNYGGPGFTGR